MSKSSIQEWLRPLIGKDVVAFAEYYFGVFLSSNSLFFIGWAVVYVLGAYGLYRFKKDASPSFIKFLFPPQIYTSPSFIEESITINIRYISAYFWSFLSLSFGAALTYEWGRYLAGVGNSVFGNHLQMVSIKPNYVLLVIAVGLVFDLGRWIGHFLLHRVPALWEFHKFHHSAQYLTPLTQWRSHPVERLVRVLSSVVVVGTFYGVIVYMFPLIQHEWGLLDFFYMDLLFRLSVHFRHSHLWLSYGPYLSYIFSSPAMHQIHHSIAPEHQGKNLAVHFSLWDWVFGTLVIPQREMSLKLGLPTRREQEEMRGVFWLYVRPFLNAFRVSFVSLRKLVRPRFASTVDKTPNP